MAEPIDILLVEDNEDHIFLARRALKKSDQPLNLHVVKDGEAALRFVQRTDEYSDVPRPDLILLDLKLPGRDGFEVLEELKNDPQLKAIPVVLLTSSAAESDIVKGYDLGSNSYVTKPIQMDEMLTKLQQIPGYWANLNVLPPRTSAS